MKKSKANQARAKAVARYWRQVRAVRKARGVSWKQARSLQRRAKTALEKEKLRPTQRGIVERTLDLIRKRVQRRRQIVIFEKRQFAYFGLVDDHPEIEAKVKAGLKAFPEGSNWTAWVRFQQRDEVGSVLEKVDSEITFGVDGEFIDHWRDAYNEAGRDWLGQGLEELEQGASPSGEFIITGLHVGP